MYHQIQEQVQSSNHGKAGGARNRESGVRQSHEVESQEEKQITVAMVMDPESLEPQAALRKQMEVSLKKQGLFGEEYDNGQKSRTINKREAEEIPIEKLLSKWVGSFLKCMNNGGLLQNTPRFSEIRPNIFQCD